MDKEKLLENIKKPDEKLLLSKALNRVVFCTRNYEKTFTDFLTPQNAYIISDFVKKETNLNVSVFGGIEGCERLMAGFAPEYEELENDDFPITVLKISYNSKFSKTLTHRDFLGSVLGTGIVREKVGDIFLKEGCAFVFVSNDIADHICISLTKVAHTKVKCEKTQISEDFSVFVNIKEMTVTVSSLRLDTVVSAVFGLSRNGASELIKGGKVFVNQRCEENVSKNIVENTLITARGHGRVKIKSIEGTTKKGKTILSAEKYI